jgi:alkylated DNA repair dioxygenase AlkB
MPILPLTLFGFGDPSVSAVWAPQRTILDQCCWVDHTPGFLSGADALLGELDETMDWYRGRRLMYGTWYREPRRTAQDAIFGQNLPSIISDIRRSLTNHYDRSFTGLFCNYYETGQDSVAWHADRIGRTELDPLVAIVSLGGPRLFHLRSMARGPSHRLRLATGDLLVMGGATQHHWEHAVPKTKYASPRISVTMRAGGPPLSISSPDRGRLRARSRNEPRQPDVAQDAHRLPLRAGSPTP